MSDGTHPLISSGPPLFREREGDSGGELNNKIWHIALIGCGGVATHYCHRYTRIPGARLALLVDTNADAAEKAAKELGVAHWSTDFVEALAPGIDIVDISTPNHLHATQATAAMKAGKHVLLQKPIASSVEEARAIVETARKTNMRAGMYMSLFDNPLIYDLKNLIASGAWVGSPRCIAATPIVAV